jgi:N-acetylglucosamine-6-phosphate deacetylase
MNRAFTGARIFDGTALHDGKALLVEGATTRIVDAILDTAVTRLEGGTLLPGFVDLQVNGGGGVMLGDDPGPETLSRMAEAHRKLGVAAFLPTLITDTPERTRATVDAVAQAIDAKPPGIAGLHLEGPHLSVARRGAHDAALIRPMTRDDLRELRAAKDRLPALLVTLAPESVTPAQIAELAGAGVVVSVGHSDCDYDTAAAAMDAGAHMVTHLFNAMSPLTSREPGLAGAALTHPGIAAGLIADGIHVHPATIRAALRAREGDGSGEIFLVTDSMAVAGTDCDGFTLGGRKITRRDGRLTLADGTLAGADLSMATALRVMIEEVGDAPERAFARATSIPAGLIGSAAGSLPCPPENLIWLPADYSAPRWLSDL